MLKFALVVLTAVLLHLHLTQALYFHIAETERKCFIEEVPDETTVIGMHLWSTGSRTISPDQL